MTAEEWEARVNMMDRLKCMHHPELFIAEIDCKRCLLELVLSVAEIHIAQGLAQGRKEAEDEFYDKHPDTTWDEYEEVAFGSRIHMSKTKQKRKKE